MRYPDRTPLRFPHEWFARALPALSLALSLTLALASPSPATPVADTTAAGSASAPPQAALSQTHPSPDTTLLPDLPDPGFRLAYVAPLLSWIPANSRVPFEATDYGVCWLEIAAREVLDDSDAFAGITTPRRTGDLLFLEQAALLAHHYALRNRDASELLAGPGSSGPASTADPVATEAALAAANPAPARPVRLFLTNEGAPGGAAGHRGHYVLAVDRQTRGNHIAYTLRDPNRSVPGELVFDRSTGRFLRYGPFTTVRIDRSELPAENMSWIRRLVAGLLDTPGQRTLPLWIPAHGPGAPAPTPQPGRDATFPAITEPIADDELPGNMVVLADASGRLSVYFDPALITDGHDPRYRWQLQAALIEKALTGMPAFVAQRPLARTLVAVPLEALARDTESVLGPLSRIYGYARSRRDGRVLVLGEVSIRRPPIRLDWLTASLGLPDSTSTALWFEPDAADPFGPQRVKTEAFPVAAARSPLGDALLQGDLTLKRLSLGLDPVDVPGFRSAWDLTGQDLAGSIHLLSFWLRPRRAPGLGAWTVTSADVEAVLFDERLGAFSGAREQMAAFQPLSGEPPPLTDRAARNLTQHLDALAVRRPYLADLQAAAELRRLVSEMRARGVAAPALDRIARRRLPVVALAETIPAAGPRLVTDSAGWLGGFTFITGGIRLGGPVRPSDDVPVGDLLPDVLGLFQAPPGQAPRSFLDLRIPEILPLDPARAARLRAWLETHRAAEEFAAGRDEAALVRLEGIAGTGGDGPEVHAWRGVIRLARGEHHAALNEINRAIGAYPELLALRARMRAFSGDTAGARVDAARAARTYPHRPEVLAQQAWVLLMTRDLRGAERVLDALAALNPVFTELAPLRAELAFQRRIGPAGAARHVREVLETPQEVSLLLKSAQEALAARDPNTAVALGEQAVLAAKRHALVVSVSQPHLLLAERTRVALAGFLAARRRQGDADSALRLMDELIALRPSAWSPRILKLDFGFQAIPLQDQLRLWEEADARSRGRDPFGEDIQARRGERMIDEAGYRLMNRLTSALDRDSTLIPATTRHLARLAPRFRGTPEGRMIAVWQSVLRTLDAPGPGSGPDLAVVGAIREALTDVPYPGANAGFTTLDALKGLYAYPLTAQRDTALRALMSPDSAWQALTQRANVRWNTPEKTQQAARVLLEATLLHCDRNLTRDLHTLVLRRLEYIALRQEPLTSERAIQVVDDARDLLLRRFSARGFSRPLLVAFLNGFYDRLLAPLVEEEQRPEIQGLLATRHIQLIPYLADAATSPVERRAAGAWVQFIANHVPGQAPNPQVAGELVKVIFATQARLEAADATDDATGGAAPGTATGAARSATTVRTSPPARRR